MIRWGLQPPLRRRAVVLTVGSLVLVASMVAGSYIGTADMSFVDVSTTLFHHLGLGAQTLPDLQDAIVWQLRAPRVVEAAVVGAALAVCGCMLQAVTRNPLADPYLLGTSSGASAGAIAVYLLGIGGGVLSVAGGAIVGAGLSFVIVLVLLGRRGFDSTRGVLVGVVVGQFFSAVGSFVITASGDANAVYGITHWLLGDLSATRWASALPGLLVCVPCLVIAWILSPSLDALSFGDDTAASLGVHVRRLQTTVLVLSAVIVGTVVSTVGAIGFVGLIVPHAVRFLSGPRHRWLIPMSAIAGAVFLIWTDAIARVAFSPQEIPVGVFTAIVGVPLFVIIMKRRGQL